jgi:hypothetical protein
MASNLREEAKKLISADQSRWFPDLFILGDGGGGIHKDMPIFLLQLFVYFHPHSYRADVHIIMGRKKMGTVTGESLVLVWDRTQQRQQ